MRHATIALFLLGATSVGLGCLRINQERTVFEDAGVGDASTSVPAEAGEDATSDARSLTDGSREGGGDGGCFPTTTLGFCESFDERPLPGAFTGSIVLSGSLARVTDDAGNQFLRSRLPGTSPLPPTRVAKLVHTVASAKWLSVAFDFRPEQLHQGAATAGVFIATIGFDQDSATPERTYLVGVLIVANAGVNKLRIAAYDAAKDTLSNLSPEVDIASAGPWSRMFLRVDRETRLVQAKDLGTGAELPCDMMKPSGNLLPSATLSVGGEVYTDHDGYQLAYDNVEVAGE